MKLILHIGIEKTGTTAIQSFLTQNRQSLAEDGFAYLASLGLPSNRKLATFCMDQDRSDDHHQLLGIVEAEPRKQWGEHFIRELREELSQLEPQVHTVVISNEQLHSRLVRQSEVERVKQVLAPYFEDISVLVYIRRQDQLATSLYSTALKCGHSFDTILPTVTPQDHYYNFKILLDQWSQVFGKENLTVRIFDRVEMVQGDLLQDFLYHSRMSEIPMSNKVMPGRQNESLLPRAQQYLKSVNQHVPMIVDGRFNILRERLTNQLESQFSGNPQLPERDQAMAFCDQFTDSNRQVAKEWFDREELFSSDFSNYPETNDDNQWDFEDAVEVSAKILNGITRAEQAAVDQLFLQVQNQPESAVRLIADYFQRLNPAFSNHLRQYGLNPSKPAKVA